MKNILIISSSPTKMISLVANHFMVQSIWVHYFMEKESGYEYSDIWDKEM